MVELNLAFSIPMVQLRDKLIYARPNIEQVDKQTNNDIPYLLEEEESNKSILELENDLKGHISSLVFPKAFESGILKDKVKVNSYSLDFLENNPNIPFYYYIDLWAPYRIFNKKEDIDLPEKVIKLIQKGQGKLLFVFGTEGWFGSSDLYPLNHLYLKIYFPQL